MNFSLHNIIRQILSFIFLLILAALPLGLIRLKDKVEFRLSVIFAKIKDFLLGIISGNAFYYIEGDRSHFILSDIIHYFLSSYLYIAISGMILLILSYVLGIWCWKTTEKWLLNILGFLGMIPDFIIILLLQLAVVSIFLHTGLSVAQVASTSIDNPAIFLPILSMVIVPLFYTLRVLNDRTYDVITEDYILVAKAKGLNKRYIYFYHVTRNVTPYLKADLHKITGIMISNLFIVEYLFNLRGITTLLFQHQVKFGYQYNLVVFCFIALFLLYLFVFFTLKVFILITERALSYD